MAKYAQVQGNQMIRDLAKSSVLRSATGTALLKIGATGLAFVASLLYARILGPHDYGLYAFVIACTAILTVPASLGLPQYLVREGAKAPNQLRMLRRWSSSRSSVAGAAAAIALLVAGFLAKENLRPLFFMASPLPLLTNLSAVRQSLLQAHGWIVRSQWPALLAMPVATLSTLLAIFIIRGSLHALDLIWVTTASAAIPLSINAIQLRMAMPSPVSTAATVRPSVLTALPFMYLAGLYLLNSRIDILVLGAIKGPSEVGIYTAASRIAELTLFFSTTVNTTLAPRIAKHHAAGEHEKLQQLVSRATRGYLVATIPVTLAFVTAASYFLPLLYGTAYARGTPVLQTLAIGQFFVIAMGSVGTVLMMTGHEKLCAAGVSVGVITNILLNITLTPTYGAIGAAISTTISMAIAQVILWYWVRTRLYLKTSGFGF